MKMELENVNMPNNNVTNFKVELATTYQLNVFLKWLKIMKSYAKDRMHELGNLSLGNISSYYTSLKNIQHYNDLAKAIKHELSVRKLNEGKKDSV